MRCASVKAFSKIGEVMNFDGVVKSRTPKDAEITAKHGPTDFWSEVQAAPRISDKKNFVRRKS